MEPGMLFVGLIGAIGTMHLAAQAGKTLVSRLTPPGGARKARTARTGMRDDWYVFFHCADLYGREQATPAAGPRAGRPADGDRQAAVRQRSVRPRARV